MQILRANEIVAAGQPLVAERCRFSGQKCRALPLLSLEWNPNRLSGRLNDVRADEIHYGVARASVARVQQRENVLIEY